MRFKFKADFTDGSDGKVKACDLTVLSQLRRNSGIELTFECEGQDTIFKTHSGYLIDIK